jgi:prepilin-type N-terminal cleavage/methylation domain-containing protein
VKRGFSLIEIVCVISMICVIAGILTPVLGIFVKQNQLDIVTDVLVNDLRHAKMQAISKNLSVITVYFILDEKNQNYNEYYINDPALNMGEQEIRRVKLPKSIVVSKKDSTFAYHKIGFTRQGSVTPYACTIALEDLDTGKKSKITLTIGYTRIMRVSG